MKYIFVIFLLIAGSICFATENWVPVASLKASEWKTIEPYVKSASVYIYPEVSNPDLTASDRTVAFFPGDLVLSFTGLNAEKEYKIELAASSDIKRTQTVKAGNHTLEEFSFDSGKPYKNILDLPQDSYKDGYLVIRITTNKGPSAVLSSLTLLSTDSTVIKPGFDKSSFIIDPDDYIAPRYSPWPEVTIGVKIPRKSLNGIWKFDPDPDETFFTASSAPEKSVDIKVPGEWSMQGFTVQKDVHAGYFRTFDLPADWSEKRVKVRFDGVYSNGIVYVNGQKAGHHEGGFTPFELDITDFVKPGKTNVMTLSVCNESAADGMASGTQYAAHVLGGITRKVTLFALPEINLAAIYVTTDLDKEFKDATLYVELSVANEGSKTISDATLTVTLLDNTEKPVSTVPPQTVKMPIIIPGESIKVPVEILVNNPDKWTSETPTLYQVRTEMKINGKALQSIIQQFGFREIEVKGNQVLVNGQPVKLRGVSRHEIHPLTGRSLSQDEWEADARLFREGNVNYIRTSHYPPAEEFIEWCDKYGLWVECEAPFCWSHREENIRDKEVGQKLIVTQNLEMVTFYKNHPSILFWSLANESLWNSSYVAAAQMVKREDPSRPRTFNYFPWGEGWKLEDELYCEIGSDHYPGSDGPEKYKDTTRPINFGEYCHLNSYNRFELAADPGLRDAWGLGLLPMWDAMFKSSGVLGGALWAAIDDEVYMSDGTVWGYGQWGPLDGWRRPKPEWYHMKKTYSPVRIQQDSFSGNTIEVRNGKIVLDVLNQSNHTNLKDLDISWNCGDQSGEIISDVAPHNAGKLEISSAKKIASGGKLEIIVRDHRGLPYEVDRYYFYIGKKQPEETTPTADIFPLRIVQSIYKTEVSHPSGLRLVVYHQSKNVFKLFMGKDEVVAQAPHLMILPLNAAGGTRLNGNPRYKGDNRLCKDWESIEITPEMMENGDVKVTITGEYSEAEGIFVVTLTRDCRVTLDYDFTLKADINPRQTGIVYILNRKYEKFSWDRQSQWSTYPEDHIGRNNGTAWPYKSLIGRKIIACEAFDRPLRNAPGVPWCLEGNLLGSNDFRSTKRNIYTALFENEKTGRAFLIDGDGQQAVRAWVDGVDFEQIRVLVADYDNLGDAPFFRHKHVKNQPLKKGDRITGTHLLKIF